MSATPKTRPMAGVGNRAGDAQTAAEIALVALSLATAPASAGCSWVVVVRHTRPRRHRLAPARHLLPAARSRPGASSIASVAGLALFTSLAFYRDSSAFGLPTRETWHVMTDDLANGWHEFGTAIALVEPRTGFLVAAVFAVWLSAFLADGSGSEPVPVRRCWWHRASCSSSARPSPASASGRCRRRCGWRAPCLRPPSRMLQEDGSGWLTSHRRGTIIAAARAGGTLGFAAIVIAPVVGPLLPGAGDDALIDTRNPRRARRTISPLVDIQGRIANQSDTELFTVKAPTPAYWRLTALDLFDGRIWSSARTCSDATGEPRAG